MLIRLFLFIVVVVFTLLVLAGQMGLLRGKAPASTGVTEGKLKPPSKTENSVSSQTSLHPDHPMRAYADIAPLTYTGEPADAWTKLKQIVATQPRTTVIKADESYFYVQCTTFLLRFTDDVEFWHDEANRVIHVRSSSRLGRKDFGVNRKRIEVIRAAFV